MIAFYFILCFLYFTSTFFSTNSLHPLPYSVFPFSFKRWVKRTGVPASFATLQQKVGCAPAPFTLRHRCPIGLPFYIFCCWPQGTLSLHLRRADIAGQSTGNAIQQLFFCLKDVFCTKGTFISTLLFIKLKSKSPFFPFFEHNTPDVPLSSRLPGPGDTETPASYDRIYTFFLQCSRFVVATDSHRPGELLS